MKRKLSLLLLAFVLVFSGCGKDKEASVKDDTLESFEQTETTYFEKPEDYATVLFVKINPEFNIYLDAEGNTLAVEPLNDDAKSIVKDFDSTEKDYQKVINNIITSANEKGFVKADAHISISVTENKSDEVNVDDILSNVNVTAAQTATSLNVEVKIETSNAVQMLGDISEPSNTTKPDNTTKPTETKKPAEQSKPAATSKPAEQSKPAQQSNPAQQSKPAQPSKPSTTNKPAHTHTYSKATCTEPQTCSCGSTNGSALGHKWENATCTQSQKCSVCDATNGNALGHNYNEDGVCTRCQSKDPNFKYSTLDAMKGEWKLLCLEDEVLFDLSFSFAGGKVDCGSWSYELEENLPGDYGEPDIANSIVWNNKRYYRTGGGFMIYNGSFAESNDKVTIIDNNNKKMVLQRISDKSMKVISAENGFAYIDNISVNSVLTFSN